MAEGHTFEIGDTVFVNDRGLALPVMVIGLYTDEGFFDIEYGYRLVDQYGFSAALPQVNVFASAEEVGESVALKSNKQGSTPPADTK